MTVKRAGLAILLLVLVILAYAWIDGGEEPLRPIEEKVALPEGVL
ncbi:MAG: hypothetical protein ACK5NN_11905 [Sphingomonadaceae bacterium]